MSIKYGLETHIMLNSSKKLYCSCLALKETCSICRGLPGALPLKINSTSLKKGLRLGSFFNAKLTPKLEIWRKHYDYYDLPNGFQRTQKPDRPLFFNGFLFLLRSKKTVRIKGYLEEDPAALKKTKIEFKRCGSSLIELVTDPIESENIKEVKTVLKEYLQTIKRVCLDLNVTQKGRDLKTDFNLSYNGSERYQVKNITSLKGILTAAERSLAQLSDLQKQNRAYPGLDKTFHLKKNQLVFSRLKNEYLFSKEWNLPLYKINYVKSTKKTFYDLFLKLEERATDPLNYPFLKKVLKEKEKLSKEQTELLLKMRPKEGLKKLDLLLKESLDLKKKIYEFLVKTKTSKQSFLNKDFPFLKDLKELKADLTLNNIPFSSYTINKIIEDYFLRTGS